MSDSIKLPFALAIPSTAIVSPDGQQWVEFLAREQSYVAYVMPAGRPIQTTGAGSTNCGTTCGTAGNGIDDIKNDISEDTA